MSPTELRDKRPLAVRLSNYISSIPAPSLFHTSIF